jgi:tetratricopeptide (TPR) repeat protein
MRSAYRIYEHTLNSLTTDPMFRQRRATDRVGSMQKISLFKCGDISDQHGRKKMVADCPDMSRPFLRESPTLISPLRMDLFSKADDHSSPQQETDRMDMQQIRVSYSEASLEITRSEGETSEDGTLFRNSQMLGKKLQDLGNYKQALQYYRTALQCKNRTIDSEPQSVQAAFADILFDIGNIHLVPGFEDRAKSMEAFHFCLDIRRACFGSSHPAVASVLYKLASIHSSFGEHQYALELLLEAVSILLCAIPEDKVGLIEVWTAIGKVQEALGQTDEAQSSFQEAEQLK